MKTQQMLEREVNRDSLRRAFTGYGEYADRIVDMIMKYDQVLYENIIAMLANARYKGCLPQLLRALEDYHKENTQGKLLRIEPNLFLLTLCGRFGV